WAPVASRKNKGSTDPPRRRRRATYTRTQGVRHLFAALDLRTDKMYGPEEAGLSPAAGGLRVPWSDRSSYVGLEAKDARLDTVPLYEVTEAGLVARPVTSFADLGLYERHGGGRRRPGAETSPERLTRASVLRPCLDHTSLFRSRCRPAQAPPRCGPVRGQSPRGSPCTHPCWPRKATGTVGGTEGGHVESSAKVYQLTSSASHVEPLEKVSAVSSDFSPWWVTPAARPCPDSFRRRGLSDTLATLLPIHPVGHVSSLQRRGYGKNGTVA
ncbi:MAG TPA: hypothetical protein VK988_03155, partial [Acidimicrobiales bacterium]|nr:hypothetical protein [Acidimicrobiales bacterium]